MNSTNSPARTFHARPVFLGALALAAFALAFITVKNEPLMAKWYTKSAYYFMTLMVFVWAHSIVRCLKTESFDAAVFLRRHAKPFLWALALCAVIGVSVKPMLRVLSDETNLLSVSRSMTYHRTVENLTHGYHYYNNFYTERGVSSGTEKHPLLFPYFTHLTHVLTGYRAENPYLLNWLVLLVLLCLLAVVLSEYWRTPWVIAALTFVAAQPVVSQCAMSGGFDLFFALFALISYVSLKKFIERPTSERFAVLWMSLVLFVNTRQESVLFFVLSIGALLVFRYLKKSHLTDSIVCALTPLLFLPIFWQRLLVKDPFEHGKGEAPFSVAHFLKNNILFFKSLLNFGYFIPYATLVNCAGVAGLLYAAYLASVNHPSFDAFAKDRRRLHWVSIVGAGLLVQWTLITSFYRGIPDHPSDARYFVLFVVFLSVVAVFALRSLRPVIVRPSVAILLSLGAFALYHPVSIEGRFTNTQTLPRKQVFVIDWLKKNAGQNILIITDRPGQYIVYDYGAINFGFANARKRQIIGDHKRRLHEEVYVVQEVSYADGKPVKGNELDADFKLETVAALQNTATIFVRIAKLVEPYPEVKPSAPAKPAPPPAPAKPAAPAAAKPAPAKPA